MKNNATKQIEGLSSSGIALVVTQLFRLLFGGYLIAFDLYYYNDLESASTVFMIYVIIGILTTLILVGRKKPGLFGLIALSVLLLIMETIYIGVYVSAITPDPSWHDPFASWWSLVSNYMFPLLTLVFSFKIYREM